MDVGKVLCGYCGFNVGDEVVLVAGEGVFSAGVGCSGSALV